MKSLNLISTTAVSLLAAALFAGCSPETASMSITRPDPVVEPLAPLPDIKVEVPPEQKVDFPEIPANQLVPDQEFPWVYEDGGHRQLQAKPQVDILFVVDNSDSMRTAQENLVTNINKFSKEIGNNKMIDYHIGVISVWDYSAGFKPDQFGIGELRTTKDGKRFVTRNDSAAVLGSTLKIGVKALKDGGPQHEEIYAPLVAALEKSGNGAPNDGFFRQDAQLVVIFLTDADEQPHSVDATGTKPVLPGERPTNEAMYKKLVDFKGGVKSKVSAYGVLVPANADETKKDYTLRITPRDNPGCYTFVEGKTPVLNGLCPKQLGPKKLQEFVLMANSAVGSSQPVRATYLKDLTSPRFGDDLKDIGEGIKVKTMTKVIELKNRPMPGPKGYAIEVWYGTPEEVEAGTAQLIPNGVKGWLYDLGQNSITLSGNIEYKDKENARYIVRMKVAPLKQ